MTENNNHTADKRSIPDGVWTKCEKCKATIFDKEFQSSYKVCPKCGFHHKLNAKERIDELCDKNTFKETNRSMKSPDPLKFKAEEAYDEYYKKNCQKTGLSEGIVTGKAKINGFPVAMGIMDFRFMGGSMGTVVGEKIALCAEDAIKSNVPLILVTASGGARMQEGILSLMQMAKTSLAMSKANDNNIPIIILLTNPTTGGVLASFASLADIIIAEPGAHIGFTGPRVIEKTMRQRLPEGFQTSEFLLKHGMADLIVRRVDQKDILSRFITFFRG